MSVAPRLPSRRPWHHLHVRAALVSAPVLLGLGAGMVGLLQHYSAEAALEAGQRMNLGLARYVVEQQSPGLLGADGRPDAARMHELAMHVMKINPAVEVYLLDAEGRVIGHALEPGQAADPVGVQVDLATVHRLLRADDAQVRLPVRGTDPQHPGRANTFSVAVVQGHAGRMGYLYIVLDGRTARTISANLANSNALRAMALAAMLASALAVAVLWVSWRQLTRPLRCLANDVEAFRVDGAEGAPAHAGDERERLRAAIAALQARVTQQFQHLEQAEGQRRELVGNISHDLRTPLSSIRGYLDTVLIGNAALDAASRAAHLRTALRHVEILGRRVDDLMELSKLEATNVALRREPFCLAELLQDVVQNYQLPASQRGIGLALAPGSQVKTPVIADIAMIERVLQNLVDNALRSTSPGGRVQLAIEQRARQVRVIVSDNGKGIAAQDLPHIFERYWRAGQADTAGFHTGSGLGLAIVKRILDLHGSAVQVRSEPATGTQFEFLLQRQDQAGIAA